jgi:cysteine-rich repeat protein
LWFVSELGHGQGQGQGQGRRRRPGRAWIAAAALSAAALSSGCSLTTVDSSDCSSHQQCTNALGDPGARCSPSGFCIPSRILLLGDSCTSAVPRVALGDETEAVFVVDTAGLDNAFEQCTGTLPVPGEDGVLTANFRVDEKWHFHVRPLDNVSLDFDPAVYVMSSCESARSCQAPIAVMDRCGPGKDEHFSFTASAEGEYYLVLDNQIASSTSRKYELSVVKPVCGNGIREHDETCDDGNESAGDGCDDICRTELSTNGLAEEANDDHATASTVILDSAGQRIVWGALPPCDVDYYGFQVAAPATLRVDMGPNDTSMSPDALPTACVDTDAQRLIMKLYREEPGGGRTEITTGIPPTGSTCPALAYVPLDQAGKYTVELTWPKNETKTIDYRLLFRVTSP